MQQVLLDTNIVIYLLKSDLAFISLMEQWGDRLFSISIVTWIEILAGSFHHQKDIDELRENLNDFILLPIDMKIGRVAAELIQDNVKNKRKKNFQDAAIAATAIAHNMPLVTNNPKDFRQFRGLKIISPKARR
jgi:predicted nucleic acid-binding protein